MIATLPKSTCQERRRQLLQMERVRTPEQEAALQRLVALLHGEVATGQARVGDPSDELHQRALLSQAHASYALAHTDEMVRVSEGAWIRCRR